MAGLAVRPFKMLVNRELGMFSSKAAALCFVMGSVKAQSAVTEPCIWTTIRAILHLLIRPPDQPPPAAQSENIFQVQNLITTFQVGMGPCGAVCAQ
jgi:hypothetical protein